MNFRSGFMARTCVLFVLSATMLSSCGGGSPADKEEGPEIVARAPEMTITPPEARAPQAVGAIPAQTLTAGGNPRQVDIAPFFQDPDNDPLTYSAESSDPGAVSVGMSGTTLTLTPVSAGAATVTVTASDGKLEATQTIAATVQEQALVPRDVPPPQQPPPQQPPPQQPPPQQPPPQQPPPQQPPPQQPPVIALTGIDLGVTSSRDGRIATLRIELVPEGANLPVLGLAMNPDGAGRFRYVTRRGDTLFISFSCADHHRGVVTLTIDARDAGVEESVQFTCR